MMYCSMREPSEVAKNFCGLTFGVGARRTGLRWKAALARAISTASCVTRRTSSAVTSRLAANPHVPLCTTRARRAQSCFGVALNEQEDVTLLQSVRKSRGFLMGG